MRIAQILGSLFSSDTWAWPADWGWGLALIVGAVLIHVVGLGFIRRVALRVWRSAAPHWRHTALFVTVMGLTTLLVASLHGIEAAMWAVAYRFLGALPDNRSAMLYSLNAMTSFGHVNFYLEDRWYLMGAIEALNGWLLFGLSTAFLFEVIQKVLFALDDKARRNRAWS